MPKNGDRRQNPVTGEREIYFEPPGQWEVIDFANAPDERLPEDLVPPPDGEP